MLQSEMPSCVNFNVTSGKCDEYPIYSKSIFEPVYSTDGKKYKSKVESDIKHVWLKQKIKWPPIILTDYVC